MTNVIHFPGKKSQADTKSVATGNRPAAFDYDGIFRREHHLANIRMIREVLSNFRDDPNVDDHGHHFYITLDTTIFGVSGFPLHLRGETVIVLQNQFHDLEISDEGFTVVIYFSGVATSVFVPWNAIIEVRDPSVPFILRMLG